MGGYSPVQLVFGRNPRIPGVMNDYLPALDGTTISETLGQHLNAMHTARKGFIQAETSEKIRRALHHQIRPSGRNFTQGELVYFKRDDDKEWKGPGTVIGRDGKVVVVRNGSFVVRVHVSRVVEVSKGQEIGTVHRSSIIIDVTKDQNVDKEQGIQETLKAVRDFFQNDVDTDMAQIRHESGEELVITNETRDDVSKSDKKKVP